ncbi:MAG: hypothetical protein ACI4PX_06695, partial [Ruminococcus sp.]
MKKMIKSFLVLALAGTMTLGTGMTAYARNDNSKFTNGSTTTAESDIDSFYIIKDYDSADETANAPYSKSPAETFEYTITPYAVWNAGSTYNANGEATPINTGNMPLLSWIKTGNIEVKADSSRTLIVTQEVGIGNAKKETPETHTGDEKATIKLPTYDTVGDYWYQVEEKLGTTTGVLYGTNSVNTTTNTALENGGHNRTYYIHVQVTESNTTVGESTLVRNVTMHQSAPATTLTNTEYNAKANTTDDDGFYNPNNKVNAIENRYYAGDLVIKKEVTGNAGDKDEYFPVTVVFSKPAGTIVNSDITFTAVLKSGNTYTTENITIKGQYFTGTADNKTIKWTTSDSSTATANCNFYIKDSDTVTFSNIPYGINYSISEKLPTNDTYTNKIEFTSGKNEGTIKFDNELLNAD